MKDKFFLTHMLPILNAHIAIFDENGILTEQLSDSRKEDIMLYSQIVKEAGKDFPYIVVVDTGIVVCAMWNEDESEFIIIGKTAMFSSFENKGSDIRVCSKGTYTSAVILIWNELTGKKIGKYDLWKNNISLDKSVEVYVTESIFEYQENGSIHNPYAQELREHDSIRRGDLKGLKESIDEVYPGELGKLAEDQVRSLKNIAIGVITCASRCAIEGGINAEAAFSMADGYIRYLEEELDDPIKIEHLVREAEYNFTRDVRNLNNNDINNPLIHQVKDYIFAHIHESLMVRDIAKYIGVSPNYLSEQFSQFEGVTLKQYIIDEKIKSSEYLLKYTDYSLQEISSYCAFSSQSRFSVYFQRKNGITPARYRKKYQNGRK